MAHLSRQDRRGRSGRPENGSRKWSRHIPKFPQTESGALFHMNCSRDFTERLLSYNFVVPGLLFDSELGLTNNAN